jgi:hypothetical protein
MQIPKNRLGIFGVHATGVIAIEQQSHQQFLVSSDSWEEECPGWQTWGIIALGDGVPYYTMRLTDKERKCIDDFRIASSHQIMASWWIYNALVACLSLMVYMHNGSIQQIYSCTDQLFITRVASPPEGTEVGALLAEVFYG